MGALAGLVSWLFVSMHGAKVSATASQRPKHGVLGFRV